MSSQLREAYSLVNHILQSIIQITTVDADCNTLLNQYGYPPSTPLKLVFDHCIVKYANSVAALVGTQSEDFFETYQEKCGSEISLTTDYRSVSYTENDVVPTELKLCIDLDKYLKKAFGSTIPQFQNDMLLTKVFFIIVLDLATTIVNNSEHTTDDNVNDLIFQLIKMSDLCEVAYFIEFRKNISFFTPPAGYEHRKK